MHNVYTYTTGDVRGEPREIMPLHFSKVLNFLGLHTQEKHCRYSFESTTWLELDGSTLDAKWNFTQ